MDTVAWLEKLIAFDTVSRNSNLALIEYVADYLVSAGLSPWLTKNADGNKANLFVTLPGKNGQTNGGMVLSGHTDVVPTDGQDWYSNPFSAQIRGGCVYGRGSCDMKGFIACVLAAVPFFQAANQREPIHIALSYDEEVGCLGAPLMLAELQKRGLNPQYCIVGEPTSMRMITAHKGIHTFCCRVRGKSAHSSLTPQGVNAIEYAAKLIVYINQLAEQLQQRMDTDAAFDVPFATLSTGVIRGGTAVNIIPNECEFEFDYRNLPHMSVEEVLMPIRRYIDEVLNPTMRLADAQCGIELVGRESVPALNGSDNERLHALIKQLLDDKQQAKAAYATEGGQFQAAGIQTVICGPGDIRQAHKANEYVTLAQLMRCDRFLRGLVGGLN
ncbi:acetylornithine deacetylase [Stenoxybacter acetivorans]|uniref:acetylornithine deacetylase n=1 Tax=Stenoxybacter acetivorans TaxID=422441 RepID=UPI00056CC372|nr:acetylornithine deacetylase [Stenoxybacter acetivorans]